MKVYREQVSGLPNLQMQEAVRLLVEWRRFNPVIAGGALWAWAANNPARDVDIWLRNTRRARRAVSNWTQKTDGLTLVEQVKKSSKNYIVTIKAVETVIERRIGLFVESKTPVDVLLVPWAGIRAPEHFDYLHCAVAWGIHRSCDTGAKYYHGRLKPTFPGGGYRRNTKLVMEKLQKELWGKAEAAKRLQAVFTQLRDICQQLDAPFRYAERRLQRSQ